MLKKLKIIGAVLLLMLIGGGLGAAYLLGSGSVVVIAPSSSPVKLSDGGKELGTVAPGDHKSFELPQGKHQLKLESTAGTAEYAVNVANGLYRQGLPAAKQCFAVLDVTNYWYKKKRLIDRLSKEITVEAKFAAGKPFDMPGKVYFSTSELPQKIKDKERTKLFVQVPCDKTSADSDLIQAAMALVD